MKNKHLVLLFLLTLVVGLAVRRAPWRDTVFFRANLLRLDTAALQQLQIHLPGQPTLFLLRNDAGWMVEQEDRGVRVPSEKAEGLLAPLLGMRSIRIVKTQRPDTLGFTPEQEIRLTMLRVNAAKESISIGKESIENGQAVTYVQLPKHEGIYLVDKSLRDVFSKKLLDFRPRTLADFAPVEVREFMVVGKKLDSLIFQKNDSLGAWMGTIAPEILPDPTVQQWLSMFQKTTDLAFADWFDESHAEEYVYARISLAFTPGTEPVRWTIYRAAHLNLPEKQPDQRMSHRDLSPFVLHSSQNPQNYFALPDTAWVRQICQPF